MESTLALEQGIYAEVTYLADLLEQDTDMELVWKYLEICQYLTGLTGFPLHPDKESLILFLSGMRPWMHRVELMYQLDNLGVEPSAATLDALIHDAPEDIQESYEFGYLVGLRDMRMTLEQM